MSRATSAASFEPRIRCAEEVSVTALLRPSLRRASLPVELASPGGGIEARLQDERVTVAAPAIERVVLLGPSHRVAFRGIATSSATSFETPLGEVPLDREAIARVEKLPWVAAVDAAHAGEHSLEVHLPFLQRCLEGFRLVPLVVGDAARHRPVPGPGD